MMGGGIEGSKRGICALILTVNLPKNELIKLTITYPKACLREFFRLQQLIADSLSKSCVHFLIYVCLMSGYVGIPGSGQLVATKFVNY